MTEDVFQRILDKSIQQKTIRTVGWGKATNVTEVGCTVWRDGRPELHDVRLHAAEVASKNSAIIVPAESSQVIYAIIDNQPEEACLLLCSEIEKVIINVGQTQYEINSKGHFLQAGGQKLSEVLEDLINQVSKIIVINGRSPDVVALSQIKKRMKKILP